MHQKNEMLKNVWKAKGNVGYEVLMEKELENR